MNIHYENSTKKQIEEDCKLISSFLQNMKDGNIILSDAERLYLIAKNHFKLSDKDFDSKFFHRRRSFYKKSLFHEKLREKGKKYIENELKELAVSSGLSRFPGVGSNEIKSIYRLIR